MHDFKYRNLLFEKSFLEGFVLDLSLPKSKALEPVTDAFFVNFKRIAAHTISPARIAWKVRRDQLLIDHAMFKATGKLESTLEQFPSEGDPEWEKYDKEFTEGAREFLAETTPDQNNKLIFKYGVQYIEFLLEESKHMQDSMEALLSFIILGSWTAFESLAADLWVVAVDTGPKEIRLRLASSNKLLKSDENIDVKKLLTLEYDPSRNFGSSLRELGRVSFQKLEYIKRFYSIAFDRDFNKLFTDIEGGYIFALSAFRNALTHNAGKADANFVKQVAAFEEFRKIKPGDPLLLDGEIVRKLQNASLTLGTDLVQFVDDILSPPSR